jgi:DNA-binding NtrC family response regulator
MTEVAGDTQNPLRVLVVDDEPGFLAMLQWELMRQGMTVETAANGVEGLRLAHENAYDVIVSDITMPQMNGMKLLQHVKSSSPKTAVIITTGFGAVETAVFAMQKGAFDFILKPYEVGHLLMCIRRAADRRWRCRSCGRDNHE